MQEEQKIIKVRIEQKCQMEASEKETNWKKNKKHTTRKQKREYYK